MKNNNLIYACDKCVDVRVPFLTFFKWRCFTKEELVEIRNKNYVKVRCDRCVEKYGEMPAVIGLCNMRMDDSTKVICDDKPSEHCNECKRKY